MLPSVASRLPPPAAVDEDLHTMRTPEEIDRQMYLLSNDHTKLSPSMSFRSDSMSSSSYGYEERYTTPQIKARSTMQVLRSVDDGTQSLYERSAPRTSFSAVIPMLEEPERQTMSYEITRMQRGVITTGVLHRRRRGKIGWMERWTSSHFVLCTQYLKYYNPSGEKLLGLLSLAGCTEKSVEVMPKDSVPNGKQATIWRFALNTPQRRIVLSAATEYEMNSWLRHLRAAITGKAPSLVRDTRTDSVMPICDLTYDDYGADPIELVRPTSMSLHHFSLHSSRAC
ncbi:hypothetical protein H310_13087 [Aphanomyces invadans]|uniref:PH domain-containing protein n=1 Tax=Aphanomyces invadans TaxID=157072 RepID=A0A024TGC0_9STRA|nr:hypothetical protein H310_13087 [Aphanomyces invadans]ETV92641.1 hypothetical protein H310_13087 [Aphanomyces invadans]|eukprot:XP_008878677.1 hypothetical protein H310_13087 [Aphanomyces invadans]